MTELKPCPFCGGEAKIYVGVNNSVPHSPVAYIYCDEKDCGVRTFVYEGRNGDADFLCCAMRAWNTRTESEETHEKSIL